MEGAEFQRYLCLLGAGPQPNKYNICIIPAGKHLILTDFKHSLTITTQTATLDNDNRWKCWPHSGISWDTPYRNCLPQIVTCMPKLRGAKITWLSNTACDPSLSENHVLYDICPCDACKKIHPPKPTRNFEISAKYSSAAMRLPTVPTFLELLLHLMAAKSSQIPQQFDSSFAIRFLTHCHTAPRRCQGLEPCTEAKGWFWDTASAVNKISWELIKFQISWDFSWPYNCVGWFNGQCLSWLRLNNWAFLQSYGCCNKNPSC